MTGHH